MFLKVLYLIAALVFALGLGLFIFGASSSVEVTLLGMTLDPRPARGVGIIAMIFSVIMFLTVFGTSQPPAHTGREGKGST